MKLQFTENEIIISDKFSEIVIDKETLKRVFNLMERDPVRIVSKIDEETIEESLEQRLAPNFAPMTNFNPVQTHNALVRASVKYKYGVKSEVMDNLVIQNNVQLTEESLKDMIDDYCLENSIEGKLSEESLIDEDHLTPTLVSSLSYIDWKLNNKMFDKVSVEKYKELIKYLYVNLTASESEVGSLIVNDDFVTDFIEGYKDEDLMEAITGRRYEPIPEKVKEEEEEEEEESNLEVLTKELPNFQSFIEKVYKDTFGKNYPIPDVDSIPLNIKGRCLKVYKKYKLHEEDSYRRNRGKAAGAFRRSRVWQDYKKKYHC